MSVLNGDVNPSTVFRNDDLPRLFGYADTAAVRRRESAGYWVKRQLALLIAAAAGSAVPWRLPVGHVDLIALASACAYAGTLWFGWRAGRHNDRGKWQLHRSAAELLRSQCWRYAVCGAPFDRSVPDPDALFAARLTDGLHQLRALGWRDPGRSGPAGRQHELITPAMRALRGKPFAVRQEVYVRDRVREQRDWYHRRAAQARRALARWQALTAVGTVAALAFAAAKAYEWGSSMDLAGLASSVAAAGVAWSELRQYHPLIAAHATVAQELSTMAVTLDATAAESRWAAGVASAEEAISPEHTAWLARHNG